MFGIIHEFTQIKAKGYYRMVIASNVPFSRRFYKFNLWTLKHAEVTLGKSDNWKGMEVEFEMKPDSKYHKLMKIAPASLDTCANCESYFSQDGDAQKIVCGECDGDEVITKMKCPSEKMKLISMTEKQFSFSTGIIFTWLDAKEDRYTTTIFDNHPFFQDMKLFATDEKHTLSGWIKNRNDNGIEGVQHLIELNSIPTTE